MGLAKIATKAELDAKAKRGKLGVKEFGKKSEGFARESAQRLNRWCQRFK